MNRKAILAIPLALLLLFPAGCTLVPNEKAAAASQPIYGADILFSTEVIDRHKGREFFVDYRIQRELSREQAKEMLRVLLESDIAENKKKAQQRWLELTDQIAKETEIENTMKMKGYADAVSKVVGKNVSVMLYAKEISAEERGRMQQTIGEIADTYFKNVEIMNLF